MTLNELESVRCVLRAALWGRAGRLLRQRDSGTKSAMFFLLILRTWPTMSDSKADLRQRRCGIYISRTKGNCSLSWWVQLLPCVTRY